MRKLAYISGALIIVIVVAALATESHDARQATPPSAAMVVPQSTPAPLYLGVTKAQLIAAVGTPTNPEGDLSGYEVCATDAALDSWKIGLNAGRVNYIAPRQGCGNASIPWRDSADIALPPDAVFVGESTEANGTILRQYRSAWLKARTGCATIDLGGDDTTNVWIADLGC